MAPKLTFQPTCVDTSSDDQDGYLVLADDCLVAVLVRLDGEEHGELKGRWLLEAGFGPCAQLPSETFGTLEDAEDWVRRQLEN